MENAKGTAEMQADLAKSKVGVGIKTNNANARTAEARGESEFIRQTGTARGAEVEAVGLARARGYEAQVRALGSNATALVNVITALADGSSKFVPDILVTSGSNGGGALDGLAATAMHYLAGNASSKLPEPQTGPPPGGPAAKPGQDEDCRAKARWIAPTDKSHSASLMQNPLRSVRPMRANDTA